MGRLTATSVRNAKAGRHGDGDGLYLLVKPSGAKSWLLRIQADGRRRDVGLGALDASVRKPGETRPADELSVLQRRVLTLADAREKARQLRELTKAGRDPIVERDKDRRKTPSFEEAARAAHTALKNGWVPKNAAAFLSTLEEHAFPALGKLKVDEIDASHVRDMLEPIWLRIPVMARKVRQRVNTVLNFSRSKGWRATEAPGRSVTVGLPNQPAGRNFKAMPYADVPAFVAAVQEKAPTTGRHALLFQILTAARPGEVRAARWGQIDLDKREWRRPADMMKGDIEHVVTLSAAAISLLEKVGGTPLPRADAMVFPGKGGKPMSDMTLKKVVTDSGQAFDPHGFRSSFRDWAAEKMPDIPDPVAEAALAHVVPDKVVRAYKRTTFLDMRRQLLEAWGKHVIGSSS